MADGCSGSWKTCCSAVRSAVAAPRGSPVPGLRLKRGKAPLDTWTRMRWPRRGGPQSDGRPGNPVRAGQARRAVAHMGRAAVCVDVAEAYENIAAPTGVGTVACHGPSARGRQAWWS